MIIKYFDEFEGQWFDITGTTGTTLQFNDASGWVGVPNKVIRGNITQGGNDAPTMNILENTTGATLTTNIAFTGIYYIDSDISIFTSNTMFITFGNTQDKHGDYKYFINYDSATKVYLITYDGLTLSNGILNNTSFEIKIY